MRARMALKYAGIAVEIREISLRDKPQHLQKVSPKATVPVLLLADGQVIDESLDIVQWALHQNDQDGWLTDNRQSAELLIAENDGNFKAALDAYKYTERHPEKTQMQHRADGEIFLAKLEALLHQNKYLMGVSLSVADIAIFPFIRQFAGVDSAWFESAPYPKLRAWLKARVASELFMSVMQKQPTYIE